MLIQSSPWRRKILSFQEFVRQIIPMIYVSAYLRHKHFLYIWTYFHLQNIYCILCNNNTFNISLSKPLSWKINFNYGERFILTIWLCQWWSQCSFYTCKFSYVQCMSMMRNIFLNFFDNCISLLLHITIVCWRKTDTLKCEKM